MKICIMCESTLLQKSLEYYLSEFLCSFQESEFIISDTQISVPKPLCLIDSTKKSHIHKPFTPISLFKDIQEFYHTKVKKNKTIIPNLLSQDLLNIKDSRLQTKINAILQEFSTKIYQTLNTDEKTK